MLLFLLSIANSKQTNLSVIQGTLSAIQAIKTGALVRPTTQSVDLNSDLPEERPSVNLLTVLPPVCSL